MSRIQVGILKSHLIKCPFNYIRENTWWFKSDESLEIYMKKYLNWIVIAHETTEELNQLENKKRKLLIEKKNLLNWFSGETNSGFN